MWSTIRRAGCRDDAALQRFADRYRPVVGEFARRKGLVAGDAEDVAQEVFLRLLKGEVLAGADPEKGRFRSLLLTITTRVMIDRHRRRRELTLDELPQVSAPPGDDEEFDRLWALQLVEAALAQLEQEGSPYYTVLREHLAGAKQDRQRLWLARRKLVARIRHEIAATCGSHGDFERELAHLSRFLTSSQSVRGPSDTARG